MKAYELYSLINIGAMDKVRQHLKNLSLVDRLPLLFDLIPYVNKTPRSLKFFRDNFAQEIGALVSAKYDYVQAEKLYNAAKKVK